MGLNIGGFHSFGIHGQDLFFNVSGEGCLLLLDQLGFKVSFAIPGKGKVQISESGFHSFFAVAIATVVGLFIAVVILAVAELLV